METTYIRPDWNGIYKACIEWYVQDQKGKEYLRCS